MNGKWVLEMGNLLPRPLFEGLVEEVGFIPLRLLGKSRHRSLLSDFNMLVIMYIVFCSVSVLCFYPVHCCNDENYPSV